MFRLVLTNSLYKCCGRGLTKMRSLVKSCNLSRAKLRKNKLEMIEKCVFYLIFYTSTHSLILIFQQLSEIDYKSQ